MGNIRIRDFTDFAAFEADGVKLRNEIQLLLSRDKHEKVTLDFDGITMFATMFFNASVGYYTMQYGEEFVNEHIIPINLTELGKATYSHSIKNALLVRNNSSISEALKNLDSNEE